MIQESNYDDIVLQPGEDREFKNQFTEFLKKNMPVDEPVKKKTTKKKKEVMKIALLNDTHFGCRNDSPAFIEYQNKFYNDLFFPYLQQNNIKCLIHLGDVVDRRKFINHNTAHNFKKVFWNRLDELDIDTHIIIGNHDTYYKNTNEVNAMQNLDISKDAKVYTHATTVEFDGLPILFIPWICDDNENESIRTIENTTSSIAMGHLEIKGFEMHSGHMNEHGHRKVYV